MPGLKLRAAGWFLTGPGDGFFRQRSGHIELARAGDVFDRLSRVAVLLCGRHLFGKYVHGWFGQARAGEAESPARPCLRAPPQRKPRHKSGRPGQGFPRRWVKAAPRTVGTRPGEPRWAIGKSSRRG